MYNNLQFLERVSALLSIQTHFHLIKLDVTEVDSSALYTILIVSFKMIIFNQKAI